MTGPPSSSHRHRRPAPGRILVRHRNWAVRRDPLPWRQGTSVRTRPHGEKWGRRAVYLSADDTPDSRIMRRARRHPTAVLFKVGPGAPDRWIVRARGDPVTAQECCATMFPRPPCLERGGDVTLSGPGDGVHALQRFGGERHQSTTKEVARTSRRRTPEHRRSAGEASHVIRPAVLTIFVPYSAPGNFTASSSVAAPHRMLPSRVCTQHDKGSGRPAPAPS